jgi:hypothetical protein
MKAGMDILKRVYERVMAKKYRMRLSERQRVGYEWKAVAWDLFRTKGSYSER